MTSTPCNIRQISNRASMLAASMSPPPLQNRNHKNQELITSSLYVLQLDQELRAQRELTQQLAGADSQQDLQFSAHVASAMRVPEEDSLERKSNSIYLRPSRIPSTSIIKKKECAACAKQAMRTPKRGSNAANGGCCCTCDEINISSQAATYFMTPTNSSRRTHLQQKQQLSMLKSLENSRDHGIYQDDLYIESPCLQQLRPKMPRMSSSTPTSPSKPWIRKGKPPAPIFQVDSVDDDDVDEHSFSRIHLRPKLQRKKSRSNSSSPILNSSSNNDSKISESFTLKKKLNEDTEMNHSAVRDHKLPRAEQFPPSRKDRAAALFLPRMSPDTRGNSIKIIPPSSMMLSNNMIHNYSFTPFSPRTPVA